MKNERSERLRVQRRLTGLAAEERIASVKAETCTTVFAEVIEARYLVGAGVGLLQVGAHEARASSLSLDPSASLAMHEVAEAEMATADEAKWTSPEARAFHEGAASALKTLMEVMKPVVPTNG